MLRRMAMVGVAPGAFLVRDGGCGLVSVQGVLDGYRRILTNDRAHLFVSAHVVRRRPFLCQRHRQLFTRGNSSWTCDSELPISSHSLKQDFDNDNNVARPTSCRRSSSRIYSEGRMDRTPAKYVGMAGSSLAKFSRREPLPAINNEILIKSIIYEAQRGCINVVGNTKRFDDFLLEQVTAQGANDRLGSSSEARKVFQSLSEMIKQYDEMGKVQRLGLLNKIAETLGFESLIDLISHDTAAVEASQGLQPFTQKKNALSGGSGLLNGNLQNGRVSEKLPQANVQRDYKQRLLLRQVPGIKYGNSDPIKLPERVVKSSLAVITGLDTEAPKSSLPETKTRRKIDLDLSESSRAVQQIEPTVDFDVPESSESIEVEGPESVRLKKTRTRVLQPAEKYKSSLVRSVVNVSNASKNNFDNSTSIFLTEKSKSSTVKAFVVDEKWGLDTPISIVKSLSAPNRARLEESGFNTMRLLLQHFPRMYQNFQQAGQRVEDGQNLSFVGSIVQSRGVPRGLGLGLLEVIVKSEVDESMSAMEEGAQNDDLETEGKGRTVFLHLKRFFKGSRYSNLGFLNAMASKYPQNAQVTVCGKVKQLPQRDHFEIREFNIELWDGTTRKESGSVNDPELLSGGKLYPVYSGKGSLQPKTIEFCIQRLLPSLTVELDPIPTLFREQLQIQELHEAYKGIHSPNHAKDAEVARQRLVFDEFFYLQLGMLLQRQELADKCGLAPGTFDMATVLQGGVLDMGQWSPLTLKLLKTLPYSLTDAQIKATGEIIWDLRRPLPMSRLLQGDVGCGKTIVAFLALLEVLDAGYQGALMAPTEFLAIQHYQRITSWLEKLDEAERPRVALLTGSTTLSKARAIRRGFESGEIALAVGTHSLTSDSVKFSALRLAVIDEQHRFGVSQRGRLNSKVRDQTADVESNGDDDFPKAIPFRAPHILAMSATPIPRTLALAIHGDMSLSQIKELPPGRVETTTHALYGDKKGRQAVYKRVRKELEAGGRVFVVFPVIDESEEIPNLRAVETEFKNLEEDFKEFKFGMVHGRMRTHEKEEAMERFKAGETQVLVSTTVIEVGIDIPEASMIVIEHAERYGMAQLHQLRGRVGRGTRTSSCILLGSGPSSLARLKLLETSKDGFYLAEIDLQQRGPGDMLGKRQSGYLPEFNIARLEKDGDVLEQARSAAEEMLQLHPKLDSLPKIRYELSMRRPPAPLS